MARRHLRSLFGEGTAVGLTDDQLLERYATRRPDVAEPAFAALVERHGPMVLGVCRSVLRDEHAAHDAFQAAFLVLARKAGSLHDRGSVAAWLHVVARRIAVRSRAVERRRRAVERSAAAESGRPGVGEGSEGLREALHDEIGRLPGRLREAVVLCELEGVSYEGAAEAIGCPLGTLKSRLARGRGLLRDRLARRGVAPGVAPAVAVPPALAAEVVENAPAGVAGRGATTGAAVAALVEGELRAMMFRAKSVALSFLVAGVLATGLVALAQGQGQERRPPAAGGGRPGPADGGEIDRFAGALRDHPVIQPDGTFRFRMYLLDLATGKASLVVDEPGQGHAYCGSPFWSADGRQILFDATPLTEWDKSRMMAIRPGEDRPKLVHLGLGCCPNLTPDGKRILFLSNDRGAPTGLYIMDADGSNRAVFGGAYGRPKLAPDGRRALVTTFSAPCEAFLIDVETGAREDLAPPDLKLFPIASWSDPATIVAPAGAEAASEIALIDVADPREAKVKQILWKKGAGLDVAPASVVYHPGTRRCIFVGEEPKGRALYAFTAGEAAAPARLEARGLDHNIGDLALSPDGRFLLFTSDRSDP